MYKISIDLNHINPSQIEEIAHRIIKGEVGVIPTDTCYGLATNPNIKSAIEKVYKIKNRDLEKQISCIYKDLDQIKFWSSLTTEQEKIIENNLPGAFTFVLTPNINYPLEGETAGIRIPDNEFIKQLSQALDIPYTSTSANLAGQPS